MPQMNKNNNRSMEIEKRKLHRASKKRNSDNITEEELEKLFSEVESKFQMIESTYEHVMKNLFSNLRDGDNVISICSTKLSYDLKLSFKRNKKSIKIDELELNIDNLSKSEHFFSRNINSLKLLSQKNYGSAPTINPLMAMINFQKLLSDLKNNYDSINRSNINKFIKDIDEVLKLYYTNPSINSMTKNFSGRFAKFNADYQNYYYPNIFRIIKEDIRYSNVNNVSKIICTQYFEYFSGKYKITFTFSKDNRSYEISLAIFEYKTTGWVLVFAEGKPDNIFKAEEKSLISSGGNTNFLADKIINYSIGFIQKFENYKVGVL